MIFTRTAFVVWENILFECQRHEEARVNAPQSPPSITGLFRIPGARGIPFTRAGQSSLIGTTMWASAKELDVPDK